MKLKQLFTDEDAVSPVIGVILMVAITVILAAVIGTFVLGLGDQVSESAPTASFTFEYGSGGGPSTATDLTITHDGGDGIDATKLYIDGDQNVARETWDTKGGSASGGSSKVIAGDSVTAQAESDETVRVIWEGSSDSATLGKWTGPDA